MAQLRDQDLAISDAARMVSDQVAKDIEHDFPRVLVEIINNEWWREFVRPNGEAQHYGEREFVKFLTTPPTRGLGTTTDFVMKVCAGNDLALSALSDAIAQPVGRPATDIDMNHINKRNPSGLQDTVLGAHAKLKRDAPEQHARVLMGELSPHAAMVEAGFRRPRRSLYIDDPNDAARLLAGWFGPRLNDLLAALAEYIEVEA